MDSLTPDEDEFLGSEPIEEGEYRLRYVRHNLSLFRGNPKVIINFQIVGSKYDGRIVPRYYNVEKIGSAKDQSSDSQNWKPKKRGNMVRELIQLFADRYDVLSARLDRLPIRKWFSDCLVIGEIVMVKQDADGNPIHPNAQHAKIKRLISIADEITTDDLTFPCLTRPSLSHPHPVDSAPKQSPATDSDEWLGKKDRQELGIQPPSPDQIEIDRLILEAGAKTGEDIERLTNGRISAELASKLAWVLE